MWAPKLTPWSEAEIQEAGLIRHKGVDDIILSPGQPTRPGSGCFPFRIGKRRREQPFLTVWSIPSWNNHLLMAQYWSMSFEEEKQNCFPKGEVRTYVVSTAPFMIDFFSSNCLGKPSNQYDIVLDPPLLTSDGKHVTGRIDLTVSVIAQGSRLTSVMPETADRLLQLPGLSGDVVTKSDVARMIKGELSPKLLALDFSGHTADELRGDRELLQDISGVLRMEVASAIDRFGLQLDDFQTNWAPQPQKAEPIKQLERDSRLEDPKSRRGSRSPAPAKSAPKQTRTQDPKSRQVSRHSQTRPKRSVNKSTAHMTVLEKFIEAFPGQYKEKKSNDTITVKTRATVYFRKTLAGPNEARIHSRWVSNFPNARKLQSYLERNNVPIDARPDYKIGPEHVDQVIAILKEDS